MPDNNMGFIRVACGCPRSVNGDIGRNTMSVANLIMEAEKEGAGIILLPPQSFAGTGCGDLFFQEHLRRMQEEAIGDVADTFSKAKILAIAGCFERHGSTVYDAYAVFQKGDVICGTDDLVLWDDENELLIGFDDDCHIQMMTSDEEITVGQMAYTRELVKITSAKNKNIVMFAAANGILMIAENGKIMIENGPFDADNMIICDVDTELILHERITSDDFDDEGIDISEAEPIDPVHMWEGPELERKVSSAPFRPDDPEMLASNCREIFEIQSAALAKRLAAIHAKKSVVGISGGLDSTLALLVCTYAHRKLGMPTEDIIAITMPGFGTTDRTYDNALAMMKSTGATVREISIVDSVTQHFKDIDHDINDHSVTYENAQARERTQILMDIANKEGGIVVGTGDLSEEALGWCTFNGDHISMYGVNAGVPKSAIKDIVRWVIDVKLKEDPEFSKDNDLLAKTLEDILNTPISPELLPPDEAGNMTQKTEDKLGPYELHDFFIYHTVRYGATPEKLFFLACKAFEDKYDEEYIKKWLETFYRRFFTQQFKRSCSPDSPRVGTVDLSPAHWNMPSDASSDIWVKMVKGL